MHITLYYLCGTATSRCVLLTGAALNIEFILKDMSASIGHQLPDELKDVHPVYVVPVIKDGDFILWESRAIATYLAEKYDKRVKFNLYPSDPEIRSIINHRLYFDMGTLYASFCSYYYPPLFEKSKFDPIQYQQVEIAFKIFNKFLEWQDKLGEENLYSAADWLTIADLSLAATVATFIACDFRIEAYPFVEKWYNTVKKIPNFNEANIYPLRQMRNLYITAINARDKIEE